VDGGGEGSNPAAAAKLRHCVLGSESAIDRRMRYASPQDSQRIRRFTFATRGAMTNLTTKRLQALIAALRFRLNNDHAMKAKERDDTLQALNWAREEAEEREQSAG
jgi:hypothetical protein